MTPDVFISYAKEDVKMAEYICKNLENNNISCWIYKRDNDPIKSWPEGIINAINTIQIMVLIISSKINDSTNVLREVERADKRKIPIIQFFIEDVVLSKPFEFFLSIGHPIQAFILPLENHINKLIETVRRRLDEISESKKLKQLTLEESVEILIKYYENAEFEELGRLELKSPLELIKESPNEDKVLPIMSKMFQKTKIPEQIQFAKEKNYVKEYSNSWADFEIQIIGCYLLHKKLSAHINTFTDMYDAGCANCGQYKALISLAKNNKIKLHQYFQYFGQDYNSDWRKEFDIENGEFILEILPEINSDRRYKHTLISCTHTLHFLGNNPLGMYTTLFSFNLLLKEKGFCYITIPEKSALPGMLDLLYKAAIDAKFEIIESGKFRLIHTLREEPLNITTFSYLIIQKQENINYHEWKQFIGASFYRAGCFDLAKQYGISDSGENIPTNIYVIEGNLNEIITQKDLNFITFRHALDVIKNKWRYKIPELEKCRENIKKSIEDVHKIFITRNIENRESSLKLMILEYFFWLLGFFISRWDTELNREEILNVVYSDVKKILNSPEDIRVNIDHASEKEITRLLRHLFELCQYEHIDLRKAFDEMDYSNL